MISSNITKSLIRGSGSIYPSCDSKHFLSQARFSASEETFHTKPMKLA